MPRSFDTAWRHVAFEVGANQPVSYVYGSFPVCLDRPGRVEILQVSLEYTINGLRVDAFAVAQPELIPRTDLPVEGTPLTDFGYDVTSVFVDRVCDSFLDLGVQVSKPTASTARGANLLIEYQSDGKTYTLRSEFELILREGDGRKPEWARECEFWYDIEQYQAATAGRSPAVATGQLVQRSETGQT
ncbi:MAG: hypothetical protein IRY85_09370 [Micromonosporaceae bacterium]|nr:hypothetical protein [Micromonosporaceae bacterium]